MEALLADASFLGFDLESGSFAPALKII
jgi:hypothetical protein